MKIRNSDKFSVELKDENYFLIDFFEETEIEIEDIHKLVSLQKELGGERKLLVLILTKPSTFTSLEVLNYIAEDKNVPYSKMDAFVLSSIGQRILANLYKRLNPNKRPTGYFKNMEAALNWIRNNA